MITNSDYLESHTAGEQWLWRTFWLLYISSCLYGSMNRSSAQITITIFLHQRSRDSLLYREKPLPWQKIGRKVAKTADLWQRQLSLRELFKCLRFQDFDETWERLEAGFQKVANVKLEAERAQFFKARAELKLWMSSPEELELTKASLKLGVRAFD